MPTSPNMFNTNYLTLQYAISNGPAVDARYGDLFTGMIDKAMVPLLNQVADASMEVNDSRRLTKEGQHDALQEIGEASLKDLYIITDKVKAVLDKDLIEATKDAPQGLPHWSGYAVRNNPAG